MAKTMTCGEDNVAEFNARLRSEMPEFREFARALHARGMIDGLRGARIASLPEGLPRPPGAVAPVLSRESESRIADRKWQEGNR